jgi:hypothetical protein
VKTPPEMKNVWEAQVLQIGFVTVEMVFCYHPLNATIQYYT